MAKKVAVTKLNASTLDILNVIRANASAQYQDSVPEVVKAEDIPNVGDVLFGYPALANEFVGALVNRISRVIVTSAIFNNPYRDLKKGFLEFGETIENVFTAIAKVRAFRRDKAPQRELAHTEPDIKAEFYAINWNVQYPVSIDDQELKKAFLSMDGVQDMIARLVDSVYQAANYDEYLLFKYLIIKGITHGKIKALSIDTTNPENAAKAFRSTANKMGFLRYDFNERGVRTNTPIDRQVLFMDADFQAEYGVDVLASAFNMSEVDYLQRVKLIDSWDTFDNERWADIRAESSQVDLVTEDELTLMRDVKAVLLDSDWFQVYDARALFTEKYIASGLYWNYFYNRQMIVASNGFANAVTFVQTSAPELPATVTATVTAIETSDIATVVTLSTEDTTPKLAAGSFKFTQNEQAAKDGIAVHTYGAIIAPAGKNGVTITGEINGTPYTAATASEINALTVGTNITLNK